MARFLFKEFPNQEGGGDDNGVVNRTREFGVLWDQPGLRPGDILNLRECPRRGDPHPESAGIFARQPRAVQVSRYHWRVTVSYSNQPPDERSLEANPLNRRVKINLRTVRRAVPILVDKDGRPLTNTAGQVVAGLMTEISDYVLNCQKNVAAVPNWIDDFQDAVNDSDIRIWGRTWKARHLKMVDLAIDEAQEGDFEFFSMSFQLQHRRGGWDTEYLNMGREEVNESLLRDLAEYSDLLSPEEIARLQAEILQPILIGNPPRPTSEDVFLDENGRAYRDEFGNVRTRLEPSEIIVIRRRTIPERPFGRLPVR